MSATDLFRATLKRFRQRRNWSQERLAGEAEMDHSLVSRLEAGARNPTPESLGKLVPVLNVSAQEADYLYLAAGLVPPEVDPGDLLVALSLVRESTPRELHAAKHLIATARQAGEAKEAA